jgi:hypothetical protein
MKQSTLFQMPVKFPPPHVPLRVHETFVDFARTYHQGFIAKYPHTNLSQFQAILSTVIAMEQCGRAIRCTEPDGTMTWKPTDQLLGELDLEPNNFLNIGAYEEAP